jgi:hypothetical protein
MRRLAIELALLASLAVAPATADNRLVAPDSASAASRVQGTKHRGLAWTPLPREATDWYGVTEVGWNGGLKANDGFLTNSIGVMRNVDPSWAVGASVDAYTYGDGTVAVTIRARRWFARRQAAELAVGWLPSAHDNGPNGAILTARYAPAPLLFVQAGLAADRERQFLYTPPYTYIGTRSVTRTRAFYGAGVSGPAGLIAMVTEIAVLGAFIAAWSGAD